MSAPKRRGLRLSGGTKLVAGGVAIIVLGYVGWTYGLGYWLTSKHFGLLTPGKVTLLGLKTGHGFTIQVSNREAQLVEAKGFDFTAPEQGSEDGGDNASKKRIPVDSLVKSLEGDEDALSKFVTSLGGFQPHEDWPAGAPIWAAEDIQKAFDGDAVLRGKLEKDLATRLDGSPVDQLDTAALANGIIVVTSAPVHVQVGAENKVLHAHIKRWYQTVLATETASRYEKLFKVTPQEKLGYYMVVAKEQADAAKVQATAAKSGGKNHGLEDVKGSLGALLSTEGLKDAVARTEEILGSAQVVLTDSYIVKASYAPSSVGVQSSAPASSISALFDLDIQVNDEGRMRLWQYSKLHPHDQLLLVSNGVAIAAPRIRQELMSHDLTIVQMPDQGLVEEAVKTINNGK